MENNEQTVTSAPATSVLDDVTSTIDQMVAVAPVVTPTQQPAQQTQGDNNYPSPVYEPVKPNTELFVTHLRTFGVFEGKDMTMTDGLKDALELITSRLHDKGFTYRAEGSYLTRGLPAAFFDNFQRKEVHLPFKNFGNKIDRTPGLTIATEKPTKEAIGTALYFKLQAFPKYTAEKFNAGRDVGKLFAGRDTHIILGQDLLSPLTLMILNTEKGEEAGDRVDFDTAGNVVYPLLVAKELSIPTFNLQKEGALDRLLAFIDNM
jgi:hypothetical protein